MRTLIIPCAGKSARFPNMKPKFLLTHPSGQIMVQKSMEGLNMDEFDRIIITIVKHHSDQYEARVILEQVFQDNSKIELLELDDFTSCQAETVYQTVMKKRVSGPFVSKDSDNCVNFSLCKSASENYVVGLDINSFEKEIYRLSSKSFLHINHQGLIENIVEKSISSPYVCLGVYGFSSADSFCQAYSAMSTNSLGLSEIYLSHIVAYMIGTGQNVFSYIQADDYEDWGTLQDWQEVQKRYATYFVDVDGVLYENKGKYGIENWSNNKKILGKNADVLRKLSCNNAQIIFTTSREECYREDLEKMLLELGINYHAIVMNCHHAPRILVNDFAPTNPYPSSIAVNIPRNANLEDYITI